MKGCGNGRIALCCQPQPYKSENWKPVHGGSLGVNLQGRPGCEAVAEIGAREMCSNKGEDQEDEPEVKCCDVPACHLNQLVASHTQLRSSVTPASAVLGVVNTGRLDR